MTNFWKTTTTTRIKVSVYPIPVSDQKRFENKKFLAITKFYDSYTIQGRRLRKYDLLTKFIQN